MFLFYINPQLLIVSRKKNSSGKTFLASALGNCAARNGHKTVYCKVPELLLEIRKAKDSNRYLKFMDQLKNIKLLILDDGGLKSYTLEERKDILEITEARNKKNSTILSARIG